MHSNDWCTVQCTVLQWKRLLPRRFSRRAQDFRAGFISVWQLCANGLRPSSLCFCVVVLPFFIPGEGAVPEQALAPLPVLGPQGSHDQREHVRRREARRLQGDIQGFDASGGIGVCTLEQEQVDANASEDGAFTQLKVHAMCGCGPTPKS